MDTIDQFEALALLEKVVQRHGEDTTYQDRVDALSEEDRLDMGDDGSCVYAVNGEPLCLIGCLLVEDLGVDPLGLNLNDEGANDLLPAYGFTDRAASLMRLAQTMQDQGAPWGDVLRRVTTVDPVEVAAAPMPTLLQEA